LISVPEWSAGSIPAPGLPLTIGQSTRPQTTGTTMTITVSFRSLAEISEQSPGYSILLDIDNNESVEITNIEFARRNGRRDRSQVECNYEWNGEKRRGSFDANLIARICD
jgi:hypothetical protein